MSSIWPATAKRWRSWWSISSSMGEMGVWVRPLDMFLETVERNGKVQYRFEEIEE